MLDDLIIWIIYVVLCVVVLIATYFLIKFIARRILSYSGTFANVVLQITVPKEKADQKEEDEVKSELNKAKTLFSVLGGMKAPKGFKTSFYGRHDHLSFEVIVDDEQLISFYMVVPRPIQRFVEQQVQAQFPAAVILETEDYNVFNPKGEAIISEMTLKKDQMFPLQTFEKMESDPLDSITNALSKFEKGEGAAIQYVIRSANSSWHNLSAKVASGMQQGKKLKEALAEAKGGGFKKVFKMVGKSFAKKEEPMSQPPKPEYKLSPMEEEVVKNLEEKTSQAGFDVNVRVVVSTKEKGMAELKMKSILSGFVQYSTYEYGNSFKASSPSSKPKIINDFIFRKFNEKNSFVLNASEMASLWHLPLDTTQTPSIRWLAAKKAPVPANLPKDGILLGQALYRGEKKLIRMKRKDRSRHMYIIGQTGSGKTEIMKFMALQDIENGEGLAIIDPHGEFIEDMLPHIPKERADDVVIFDPSDVERPLGLNMLEFKTDDQKDFAVQEMVAIFYKLFGEEMIGPMFEHYMRNAMLALMEDKEEGATIVDIPRMFTDKVFRMKKLKHVKNAVVKNFWEQEYEQSQKGSQAADMLSYIISKIGRFLTNDMMRNIIGQPKSGFNFADVMDNKKILLCNLSKGKIGEVNSDLLGFIMVSKLQMAAMARANMASEDREDFYLYIDEFQNYITDSIAVILSEARKYKLNLVMAHQYLGQLVKGGDASIRDAVFGNIGTKLAFRVGVEDAETFAKEFEPVFDENDVMNVEKFSANMKLLIDNEPSKPFNMQPYALVTQPKGDPKMAEALKQLSRLKFGKDRTIVEAEIKERSQLGNLGARSTGAPPSSL